MDNSLEVPMYLSVTAFYPFGLVGNPNLSHFYSKSKEEKLQEVYVKKIGLVWDYPEIKETLRALPQ